MNPPSSIKLSIITVHHKTEDKILALWDSLQKNPPAFDWEFIVVDNNSGENHYKRIQKALSLSSQAHFIPLAHNIGFGAGNMQGVQFSKGEILAFINPDIEVTENLFDSLLSVLESDKKNGIVTPLLETQEGIPLANTWDFPSFFSLLKKRLTKKTHTHPSQKKPFSVDWIQGSFLVMRRSLFLDTLHGFDDRFFLFLEDTDLCRRTWNAGYRVLQVPMVRAIHEQKRLSGEGLFTSMKKKTFWIHVKSAIQYFWKWKGQVKPVITAYGNYSSSPQDISSVKKNQE